MAANIEEQVIEKLRVLPEDQAGGGFEVRRGLGGPRSESR